MCLELISTFVDERMRSLISSFTRWLLRTFIDLVSFSFFFPCCWASFCSLCNWLCHTRSPPCFSCKIRSNLWRRNWTSPDAPAANVSAHDILHSTKQKNGKKGLSGSAGADHMSVRRIRFDAVRARLGPISASKLPEGATVCCCFVPVFWGQKKCINIWAADAPQGVIVYSEALLDIQEFTDPKSLISFWLTVAAAEIQPFRQLAGIFGLQRKRLLKWGNLFNSVSVTNVLGQNLSFHRGGFKLYISFMIRCQKWQMEV